MYINTQTKQYPISEQDIRNANSNTSFPFPFQAPEEFAIVIEGVRPEYNSVTEVVTEGAPELTNNGIWKQTWQIQSAFKDYTDEDGVLHTVQEQEEAAVAKNAVEKAQLLQDIITQATQQRLNSFARLRNYDSILSACTYATSTILKFKSEGQYCVEARDATWSKLYEILAEVQAGTRPVPAGYADIEADLPALEWPTL